MERYTLDVDSTERAKKLSEYFVDYLKENELDAIHTAQVSLDRSGMGEITFFDAEGQPIAVIDLAQASEEKRAELMRFLAQHYENWFAAYKKFVEAEKAEDKAEKAEDKAEKAEDKTEKAKAQQEEALAKQQEAMALQQLQQQQQNLTQQQPNAHVANPQAALNGVNAGNALVNYLWGFVRGVGGAVIDGIRSAVLTPRNFAGASATAATAAAAAPGAHTASATPAATAATTDDPKERFRRWFETQSRINAEAANSGRFHEPKQLAASSLDAPKTDQDIAKTLAQKAHDSLFNTMSPEKLGQGLLASIQKQAEKEAPRAEKAQTQSLDSPLPVDPGLAKKPMSEALPALHGYANSLTPQQQQELAGALNEMREELKGFEFKPNSKFGFNVMHGVAQMLNDTIKSGEPLDDKTIKERVEKLVNDAYEQKPEASEEEKAKMQEALKKFAEIIAKFVSKILAVFGLKKEMQRETVAELEGPSM